MCYKETMNKNRTVIICLGIIVVALLGYILIGKNHSSSGIPLLQQSNDSFTSPFSNKEEMVNTKGQHVDTFIKGTFRDKATGAIFTYTANADPNLGSSLLGCTKNNKCTEIYFANCDNVTSPHDCEDGFLWGLNTVNSPVYSGTVTKKVFYSTEGIRHQTESSVAAPAPDDKTTYTISYVKNGMPTQITTTQTLCIGGIGMNPGYQCDSDIYNVGDKILFNIIDGKIGTQQIANQGFTIGEFLSYQYYYSPNTGDVFPIVTVQQ
jgi:hypothetical protein